MRHAATTARRRPAAAAAVLGAFLAAALATFAVVGYAAPATNAAQAQYAPANTTDPQLQGSAREGETLTATTGNWNGEQPITYAYAWERCGADGQGCAVIANATGSTYRLTSADVGRTIRVIVTASNQYGSAREESARTSVVVAAGPAGQQRLPNGETSIPVSEVALPHRLVIEDVQFSPSPVRSRTQPITIRVKVKDTRGYVVRGALVFVRSTPIVTTTPPEQQTSTDGWVTLETFPERDFPRLDPSYAVQFFARARKAGEDPLAGVSVRRLVQVPLSR